jgi:hypothetical protein
LFKFCFLAWINDLRDVAPDIIAVDGKTSRRSHDRRKGPNPLHLVSAWAARQRIVLGQQATGEKPNEITAVPLLLKHLDLKGALVTMDAMGTQTEIGRGWRCKSPNAEVGWAARSKPAEWGVGRAAEAADPREHSGLCAL